MTQGNDGLRVVLDRRGGRYFWTLHESGELHEGKRGYDTPIEAVNEADQDRRQIDLWRHVKNKRSATSPSL